MGGDHHVHIAERQPALSSLARSNPYASAIYSLFVLVILSGLKVYVWLLARDAGKRTGQLCVQALGIS